MAIQTTDKPWDGSASNYPDANTYCKCSLIDENPAGQDKTKDACSLPVYEPDGTLNVNALAPAAAALAGARGGVSASAASKKSAAKKLAGLYRAVNRPIPDSLKNMAQ